MCRIKLRAEGYARPKGRYRDNLDPAGEAFVLLKVLDTGPELGMRHKSGVRPWRAFRPAPCVQQQERGGRQYGQEHSGHTQSQCAAPIMVMRPNHHSGRILPDGARCRPWCFRYVQSFRCPLCIGGSPQVAERCLGKNGLKLHFSRACAGHCLSAAADIVDGDGGGGQQLGDGHCEPDAGVAEEAGHDDEAGDEEYQSSEAGEEHGGLHLF